MSRASNTFAGFSFLVSAVMMLWAGSAGWQLWQRGPAPPVTVPTPEPPRPLAVGLEAAGIRIAESSVAGGLGDIGPAMEAMVGGLIALAVFGLSAGIIALQAILGLGLALAAASTGKGWRLGWPLHVAWAVLTLVVEVPVLWLLGGHDRLDVILGLFSIAGIAGLYALCLLLVGPILRYRGPWPWTRSVLGRKPKPLVEDWSM